MKTAHGERNLELITMIEGEKLDSDKLSKQLQFYIHMLRVGTGGVNTQVVILLLQVCSRKEIQRCWKALGS